MRFRTRSTHPGSRSSGRCCPGHRRRTGCPGGVGLADRVGLVVKPVDLIAHPVAGFAQLFCVAHVHVPCTVTVLEPFWLTTTWSTRGLGLAALAIAVAAITSIPSAVPMANSPRKSLIRSTPRYLMLPPWLNTFHPPTWPGRPSVGSIICPETGPMCQLPGNWFDKSTPTGRRRKAPCWSESSVRRADQQLADGGNASLRQRVRGPRSAPVPAAALGSSRPGSRTQSAVAHTPALDNA